MGTLINSTILFSPATASSKTCMHLQGEILGGALERTVFERDQHYKETGLSWKAHASQTTPFNLHKSPHISVLNNTQYQNRIQGCACAAISLSHLLIWGMLNHN